LSIRLAETERNLIDSEATLSQLRAANDISHSKQNESLQEMSQKLMEAEARNEELSQVKDELADTNQKLEQSKRQCQRLAETLRETQAFLIESKRQLSESVAAGKQSAAEKVEREDAALADAAQLRELRREVARLKPVEAKYDQSLRDLSQVREEHRRTAQLQSENDRLRAQIEASDVKNASLSRNVRDAEVHNRELQRRLLALQRQSELDTANSGQIEFLAQENARLQRQIDDMESGPLSPSKVLKRNETLMALLNAKNRENEALQRRVADLLRANGEFR
jgi:chromosome segregation ATPase